MCILDVTNSGNVGLKQLSVATQPDCTLPATLAPGTTASCNVSTVALQSDFDAWDVAFSAGNPATGLLHVQVAVTAAPTSALTAQQQTAPATVAVELLSRPSFRALQTQLLAGQAAMSAGEHSGVLSAGVATSVQQISMFPAQSSTRLIVLLCCHPAIVVHRLISRTAGGTAQVSFIIHNDGNVALRALQLVTPSSFSDVQCQPLLTTTLAVNSTTTCHANRVVTQEELEAGSSSFQLTLQSANLPPASLGATYKREAVLTPVQLPAVASMQAQLVTSTCVKPIKAREYTCNSVSTVALGLR